MKEISKKIILSIEQPNWKTFVMFGFGLIIFALAFQGLRAIWQPDEGYYVGTALTMYKTNSWLVPMLGKEIFLEKPPMLYWGVIFGIKILGQNEFACRLFVALCYAATVLVTGLLGYELFGKKRAGFLSAIIYATMAIPFSAGNFITTDTPLALWTTVSILFFWKSLYSKPDYQNLFKMLMYVSLGLGFLAKGPAVIIPCGGMALYLLVSGELKKFFLTPWTLLGGLLFMLIGLGWYIMVSIKVSGAAAYFWDNQVWGRLVTPKYGRNSGIGKIYIYLPVLLLGSLPWITVWLEKKKNLKSTILKIKWWKQLRFNRQKLFLMAMFFVPFVILSAASSRLILYVLPLFPILAVATSRLWSKKFSVLIKNSDSKVYVKPVVMISVWVLLLMFSRFAMARFYDSDQDARALWSEINPYLPSGEYEIVTIDKRADGLLFYGAMEVENVTNRDEPYPTFTMPDTFDAEFSKILTKKYPHFLLIRKRSQLEKIQTLLETKNFKIQTMQLNHGRWLIEAIPQFGESN